MGVGPKRRGLGVVSGHLAALGVQVAEEIAFVGQFGHAEHVMVVPQLQFVAISGVVLFERHERLAQRRGVELDDEVVPGVVVPGRWWQERRHKVERYHKKPGEHGLGYVVVLSVDVARVDAPLADNHREKKLAGNWENCMEKMVNVSVLQSKHRNCNKY